MQLRSGFFLRRIRIPERPVPISGKRSGFRLIGGILFLRNVSHRLPETWEGFKENWGIYWKLWADTDNFLSYLSAVGNVLYYVAYISLLVIPLILALWLLLGRILRQANNDYDHDSRPLSAWKRFVQTVCCPVKLWISDFLSFLRKYGTYWKLWAFLWAFYFNAFSIATEFLAFYLYFVMSFDFTTVYRQIYKLFIDLTAVLSFIPLITKRVFLSKV